MRGRVLRVRGAMPGAAGPTSLRARVKGKARPEVPLLESQPLESSPVCSQRDGAESTANTPARSMTASHQRNLVRVHCRGFVKTERLGTVRRNPSAFWLDCSVLARISHRRSPERDVGRKLRKTAITILETWRRRTPQGRY